MASGIGSRSWNSRQTSHLKRRDETRNGRMRRDARTSGEARVPRGSCGRRRRRRSRGASARSVRTVEGSIRKKGVSEIEEGNLSKNTSQSKQKERVRGVRLVEEEAMAASVVSCRRDLGTNALRREWAPPATLYAHETNWHVRKKALYKMRENRVVYSAATGFKLCWTLLGSTRRVLTERC